MEYSNVVFEEQELTISLTLKNESTNISQINWITQVCINSGVCYPPKTIEMNTTDNKTWTASVVVDEDASYLNWRIDQIDDNDTVVRVPDTGFGWKIFVIGIFQDSCGGVNKFLPIFMEMVKMIL